MCKKLTVANYSSGCHVEPTSVNCDVLFSVSDTVIWFSCCRVHLDASMIESCESPTDRVGVIRYRPINTFQFDGFRNSSCNHCPEVGALSVRNGRPSVVSGGLIQQRLTTFWAFMQLCLPIDGSVRCPPDIRDVVV